MIVISVVKVMLFICFLICVIVGCFKLVNFDNFSWVILFKKIDIFLYECLFKEKIFKWMFIY